MNCFPESVTLAIPEIMIISGVSLIQSEKRAKRKAVLCSEGKREKVPVIMDLIPENALSLNPIRFPDFSNRLRSRDFRSFVQNSFHLFNRSCWIESEGNIDPTPEKD